MKVQQKISGTFRSYAGAVAFCRIRSYVATCRKLGLNLIEALTSVFLGEHQVDRLLAKGWTIAEQQHSTLSVSRWARILIGELMSPQRLAARS